MWCERSTTLPDAPLEKSDEVEEESSEGRAIQTYSYITILHGVFLVTISVLSLFLSSETLNCANELFMITEEAPYLGTDFSSSCRV